MEATNKLWYLDHEYNTDSQTIYNGDSAELFNTDEFETKVRPIDWVSLDIVKDSIDMIVEMTKVKEIIVDFGDDKQNIYWQKLVDQGFGEVIKQAMVDQKVVGDSYIQLAVEDDLNTFSKNLELRAYNINSNSVFADYEQSNPARGAKSYTIKITKQDNQVTYYLLIIFTPGLIEWEAYKDLETNDRVDVRQCFPEYFSDDIDYLTNGLSVYYETDLEYSNLVNFKNTTQTGEFYGRSDVTNQVISKLQLLERMYNLADYHATDKAKPQRQLSKATGRLLKAAIEEGLNSKSHNVEVTAPESFLNSKQSQKGSKKGVSYMFTKVAQLFNNKLTYYEDDGQGENKYIVNPSSLEDLYQLIQKTKSELYNDLHISEILVNPDVAGQNVSGKALERLMTRTIAHVEDLRYKVEPKIKQLAFTALQIAKQSNLEDANYPDVSRLPSVTWKAFDFSTLDERLKKYEFSIKNKPSPELIDQALADILGIDLSKIQAMRQQTSLRQRLNTEINGGNN
jgi:hypothetical protein